MACAGGTYDALRPKKGHKTTTGISSLQPRQRAVPQVTRSQGPTREASAANERLAVEDDPKVEFDVIVRML